jgi:ABC-type transport system involved in multi-copper enzyme maturation permease subunit
MKSEWTKLRSLRSTVFSLLAAVVFIIGFGLLVSSLIVGHWPPKDAADAASFDPTSTSLAGSFLAQLAIGVLGVLFITGEYATGMIRATFAAVPRRLPVLWAKAAVFAATVLALTVPSMLIAFTVGQSIFSSKDIETSIGEPGVLRAVLGGAFYLVLVGLLGLAIGTLLRSTAAGISTLLGVIFVLPIIVGFLPSSWSDPISKYLPSHAGQAITNVRPDPNALGPWAGFAVFCLYVVIALGAAAVSIRRRDA